MFNLKKQEITMKEYIAPIARNINIEMESIIALSDINGEGDGTDLSNRRENTSASDAIWGSSWED